MREILVMHRLFLWFFIPGFYFAQAVDVQYFGHRGCRGLLPENTIESFQKAIDLGADGIELDVVVNKEKQLVISHEPYFQSTFCWDSRGNTITNEKQWNIYEMTQEEIRQFDCGSKIHPRFSEQIKQKSTKPLLQELFDAIDLAQTTILFEVKSIPSEYGKSQPYPPEFAKIIFSETVNFPHTSNLIFMSFDKQILDELHKLFPQNRFIFLTYLPYKSAKSFVSQLSFTPHGLGMFYRTITKRHARFLHENNMKLFAWTVNSPKVQKNLLRKKVDGIITDFPDRIK